MSRAVSRRWPLMLLAGGAALLVVMPSALPASASPAAAVDTGGEQRALGLLVLAAKAALSRSYEGTQYVATWRATGDSATMLQVRHTPESGLAVIAPATAGASDDAAISVRTDALDGRLLPLLAAHYDLSVAAPERWAGRPASVVEARRPAVIGADALAGRFWLDQGSGLVLRREVYDEHGHPVRSTAFVELDVAPQQRAAAQAVDASLARPVTSASGREPDAERLAALRARGWSVPESLPGGLQLFEAGTHEVNGASVLHLAYSDGLSRLSLFAQPGRLGATPAAGFQRGEVAGATVWMRSSTPERVAWAARGQVWTVLSDAPPASVQAVVAALPHDKPPRTGLWARLVRGLARLLSWLNPFA